MEKSPLKKVKMMDIVRRKPKEILREHKHVEVAKKEEQIKFTIEKKSEAHHGQKEEPKSEVVEKVAQEELVARPIYVHEEKKEEIQAPIEKINTPSARDEEVKAPVVDTAEKAQELKKIIPEMSSMTMDRPIAYIPKEKTSLEEKRVLERIERRERAYEQEGGKVKRGRSIFTWIISCVLLGVVTYLAIMVLPRAEISLTPKKVNWEYANTIGASTKIAEIDATSRQIPVAVFTEKKTNAFSFVATGTGKNIERKATGRVTLYNNFSASPQPLIATTRLETADGKIFRLRSKTTIPGATTSGGSLVPASIEVDVIADKAGETYNIGPVDKFTVPGFKGTAKYDGFYGESKTAMTGGFMGEGKYPTAEDIKIGKESAEKQMKEVIDSFLATQLVPEGFKIIDSSKKYAITKEVVNEGVDDKGSFSIYIEAEGSVNALKEEHVLKLMTALAQQVNGEGYAIKDNTLTYGSMSVDEKSGAIALPIEFKGVFWKPINVDDFKKNVMGKKENDLKAYIFSSTSIEKADVALWPFWVKTVPNDTQRVKVELK